MAKYCVVKAGKTALAMIRDGKLRSKDIRVIVAAAGGPKWLALNEFDRHLFGSFIARRKEPLFLLGASIGTWRIAAGMQRNSSSAIDRFEDSYINQRYSHNPSIENVSRVSRDILETILGRNGVQSVLDHPFMRLNVMSVRCIWPMSSDNPALLGAGLAASAVLNIIHRSMMNILMRRNLFMDARSIPPFVHGKSYNPQCIPLSAANLVDALLSSGSIPLVMSGMSGIDGTAGGVYRDGGIIDYHPAIPFIHDDHGLVLYPHYSDRIIPGWLDKHLPWRKPDVENLDRVIFVGPSGEFLDRLPLGKIPDRTDFYRFRGDDKGRIAYWEKAAREGKRFADEFFNLVESGKLARSVTSF
jgi:hypothetical protein